MQTSTQMQKSRTQRTKSRALIPDRPCPFYATLFYAAVGIGNGQNLWSKWSHRQELNTRCWYSLPKANRNGGVVTWIKWKPHSRPNQKVMALGGAKHIYWYIIKNWCANWYTCRNVSSLWNITITFSFNKYNIILRECFDIYLRCLNSYAVKQVQMSDFPPRRWIFSTVCVLPTRNFIQKVCFYPVCSRGTTDLCYVPSAPLTLRRMYVAVEWEQPRILSRSTSMPTANTVCIVRKHALASKTITSHMGVLIE